MQSLNFLSPINFNFALSNVPTVEFLVQKAYLPGINLGSAFVPTPFVRLPTPGNISYTDLQITLKLDENMQAYNEILDWMEALGHPDNLESQYENIRGDARITVLNSSNRPIQDFTYTDAYPTMLSPLQFDATLTDVPYFSCDVSFAFGRIIRHKVTRS